MQWKVYRTKVNVVPNKGPFEHLANDGAEKRRETHRKM